MGQLTLHASLMQLTSPPPPLCFTPSFPVLHCHARQAAGCPPPCHPTPPPLWAAPPCHPMPPPICAALPASLPTPPPGRTFGRSSRGSAFFASSCTVCPLSVSSTASTTRSICVTPSSDRPRSSAARRSPCGGRGKEVSVAGTPAVAGHQHGRSFLAKLKPHG